MASAVVLSMVLVGCGSGSSKESKKPEIALVTDSGGINDKSFNQSAWEAVKEYGTKNDKGYKYYKPASFDTAGYKDQIKNAVDNGAKVVVLPGFKFAAALGTIQNEAKYKDVKFIAIDFTPTDEKDNPVDIAKNVYCATYKEQQPGYLAGYAAVKDGYTKIGFMGGMALPAVINYGYGYLQGANDAAKEMKVNVTAKYTYVNNFNESPEIKTKATGWYNSGTEVIFSCGGQICNSVFAAAEDTNKKSIGVDSDQKDDSKTVITSAMKGVKQTVFDEITNAYNDKFEGAFVRRDIYNMRARNYILSRLENFENKAPIIIENYTIEHIMPQNKNLSLEWQTDLGTEWQEVQKKYLHTIGNLTLTAYNSEMSDRPFLEKMDMQGGFKESALRLNKYVVLQNKWNEKHIQERANELAKKAESIWPYPTLTVAELAPYQVEEKTVQKYSLETYDVNAFTRILFESLDKRIMNLSPAVKKEYKKLYVAYKLDTNFVDIVFQKQRLRISINMKFSEINDPNGICKDITDLGRWGNGDVELFMEHQDELDQIMEIVKQSFDAQAE